MGLIPGSGSSPGGGHGNLLPVFLLAESHEQRSLMGYSPWGHKETRLKQLSTTKTQTQTDVCFQIIFHYRLLQNTE